MPPEPHQPPPSPASPSHGVIDLPVAPTTSGGSFGQQVGATATAGEGTANPPPSASRDTPRSRRWLVFVGIAAAAALCCIAITVLYLKWWRTADRNCLIIVWGDEGWDGAVVEVSGPALSNERISYVLKRQEETMARFHVPSGSYVVKVRKGENVLAQRASDPLRPLRPGGVWWPFKAPAAATQFGLN